MNSLSCGYKCKQNKYLKPLKLSTNFINHFNETHKEEIWKPPETTAILHSSYSGPVELPVTESPIQDHVYLQSINKDGILIKVIDLNKILNEFGTIGLPDIPFLKKIEPSSIDINYNKSIHTKINKYKLLIEQYSNDPDLKEVLQNELRKLYSVNIPVDIYFHTIKYLEFLKTYFNRININDTKEIISIYNIPDLDNAFFTGSYMVYGNGENYFYPLGSSDIIAHELTHGLTDCISGLEYSYESGALNESISDIFAITYKHYINPDKQMSWLIGDEVSILIPFLRSFIDPGSSKHKQPSSYKGPNWSYEDDDNGGVHTNSGVPNHLFFIICQKQDIFKTIKQIYKTLYDLDPKSNLKNFSKKLLKVSNNNDDIKEAIHKCNLD